MRRAHRRAPSVVPERRYRTPALLPSWVRRHTGGARLAVVVAIAGLLALTAAGPVQPPAAAAPGDGGLRVEITGIGPGAPRPGQDVTVTGAVHNDADTRVDDVYVNLRLQRNAPTTRRVLDLWLDTSVAFATRSLAEDFLDAPLAEGATAPFTFTLPAEGLGLADSPSAWGPRGISVNVSGTAAGGESPGAWLTDSTRSLIVWAPGEAPVSTAVSVVVPMLPTAEELASAQRNGVPVATESAARLAALANASAAQAEVAWALDPGLLADAAPAPTSADDAPPEDAADSAAPAEETPDPDDDAPAPADDLAAAASARETLVVPFADADVAALVAGGSTDLLDRAFATGADLFAAAGVTPLPIAWPAAEPDTPTLAAYAARGAGAVVLPGERAAPTDITYTPTGRGSLDADGQPIDALLWDEDLSAALTGSVPALASHDLGATATAVAARQYLLAVTALVGMERPADARHLLLAVDRTGPVDPSGLRDRLEALAAAPWVSLTPVSDLLATEEPAVARTPSAPEGVPDGLATPETLSAVVAAEEDLTELAEVLTEPALLVDPVRHHLLEVTSAAWRGDPAARTAFLGRTEEEIRALDASIGVEAGGTVNLISSSGELPVTVRNDLPQPVTVLVRLTPRDPALQVPDLVEVVAPPESAQPVPVAVRAVGTADVEIYAELLTPSGRPVGDAATWTVRVRADWEGVGTAVAAGAVGLLFVVGMVRTIRRGRRRPDGEPSPAEQSATDGATS